MGNSSSNQYVNDQPVFQDNILDNSEDEDNLTGNSDENSLYDSNYQSNSSVNFSKINKKYGHVSLKVINTVTNSTSNNTDTHILSYMITNKSTILYGNSTNLNGKFKLFLNKYKKNKKFNKLQLDKILINDSRANKLCIALTMYGWYVIPFPEVFSRHNNTCLIIGDKTFNNSYAYNLKLGTCFRLGSVGLIVSEVKYENKEEQRLDNKSLEFLRNLMLNFDDSKNNLASLASDEMEKELQSNKLMKKRKCTMTERSNESYSDEDEMISSDNETVKKASYSSSGSGTINTDKYFCYMCYDTENTESNPLIAPCNCKGDTRFLHVLCLQKWYYSSVYTSYAQVIRTTGTGSPACKICGVSYKTNFMNKYSGKKNSILELENNGPYISLVVITSHENNPELFNTKFRLNFGKRSIYNNNGISEGNGGGTSGTGGTGGIGTENTNNATNNNNTSPSSQWSEELNTIVIGRSSSCTMVLDYRTVSTIHAKIVHSNGKFLLSDNKSSNGTMIYLNEPILIPSNNCLKVRVGKTNLILSNKKNNYFLSNLKNFFFNSSSSNYLFNFNSSNSNYILNNNDHLTEIKEKKKEFDSSSFSSFSCVGNSHALSHSISSSSSSSSSSSFYFPTPSEFQEYINEIEEEIMGETSEQNSTTNNLSDKSNKSYKEEISDNNKSKIKVRKNEDEEYNEIVSYSDKSFFTDIKENEEIKEIETSPLNENKIDYFNDEIEEEYFDKTFSNSSCFSPPKKYINKKSLEPEEGEAVFSPSSSSSSSSKSSTKLSFDMQTQTNHITLNSSYVSEPINFNDDQELQSPNSNHHH